MDKKESLLKQRDKEDDHIAIFHCPIQIIKRSVGRSAVAAAAYRSGERLTNEWDGRTHDYTHKPGVVHTEIMLPAHAPPTVNPSPVEIGDKPGEAAGRGRW